MPHQFINGILANCNECLVSVRRKLVDGQQFALTPYPRAPDGGRKSLLVFLLDTAFDFAGGNERPFYASQKAKELTLKSGQFSEAEIEQSLRDFAYESSDLAPEYFERNPDYDWRNAPFDERRTETHYNFPIYGCDSRIGLGFCTMNPMWHSCPDCGRKVQNTPDNVAIDYTKDLLCPVCPTSHRDPMNTKGIIMRGRPPHHGNWAGAPPEFIYTGTDYFAIRHPRCPKANPPETGGVMVVIGAWVDETGGFVLGLECEGCGTRNAIKPFTDRQGRKPIPLYNDAGGEWKLVHSRALDLAAAGEGKNIELKSTLRYDLMTKAVNAAREKDVLKAMAGFANAEGGTLVIGITDLLEIIGLHLDYETMRDDHDPRDKFQQHLTNLIITEFGHSFPQALTINFEVVQGQDVCLIDVAASEAPVWMGTAADRRLPVRTNNTTRFLRDTEATGYVRQHFDSGP